MSGGVDSSVSAALLKKEGYEVVGVFIRAWEPEMPGFVCAWREDRREAMRAAAHLDIPLITLDLSREYKEKVVDYMIREYQEGRTPNPDVMCNKAIKFGVFFDWAIKNGTDLVATGHYAQIKQNKKTGFYEMLESKDKNKDQTYFLWTLTQKQLAKTLFPVGKFQKEEVRKLAEKFKLPNSKRKDSQGLCFIGKIDFKDFLRTVIPENPGEVVTTGGQVIGAHDGVNFYTLGERHGFKVTADNPEQKPYYVVAKKPEENQLVVSAEPEKIADEKKEIKLEKISWTAGEPKLDQKYQARIRYRQELQVCTFKKEGENYAVVFQTPQATAAPGQSAVVYDRGVCLGGGIIK